MSRIAKLPALVVVVAGWGALHALAQSTQTPADTIPLTVQSGVPLHLTLTSKVPVKNAGVPLDAKVVEPVYVFDHLVIPAGAEVKGRITQVDGLSRGRRALTIANGDFTPYRKAHVNFDTLILKDGTKIPLRTAVTQGTPATVYLFAGEQDKKKKGKVGQAVDRARSEATAREHAAIQQVTAPGKMQRLKARLAAELPYHRQSLPLGTSFTAELKAPLELGQEERSALKLTKLGSEIPPGSIVHVRLVTPLSSASDQKGQPVKAVVSAPLFSTSHELVLPEGARLEGSVTQVVPARRLGRNGTLRFMFHDITLGPGAPRKVEASLQGVDAAQGGHLQVDDEGGAHAVAPKSKFVAPAIEVMLAMGSLDGLDPHNHHRIAEGLGPQGPDVAGGTIRGGAGFGLVGAVVGVVAHYRPVSACFAFYGAGWSVYTHVVARGNDVTFAKNTPMDIRFGSHEGPPSPAAKGTPFVSQVARP